MSLVARTHMQFVFLTVRALSRHVIAGHMLDVSAELVARRYPELRTQSHGEGFGLMYPPSRAIELTAHCVEATFLYQGRMSDLALLSELGRHRIEQLSPLGRASLSRAVRSPTWIVIASIRSDRSPGATGVFHGVDRRLPRRVEAARHPFALRERDPHDRERLVVAARVELRPRRGHLGPEVVIREAERIDLEVHDAPVDPRHPLDRPLPASGGRRHGVFERGERRGRFEAAHARSADLVQGARSIRMTFREEVGCVAVQGRGRPVVASVRSPAGTRRVVSGRSEPQLAPGLVEWSELHEQVGAPVPSGRRGSPRTPRREPLRRPRASRRTARGARPGAPWARPRTRHRGSVDGGTGTRPGPRGTTGPAGSDPAGPGSSGSAGPPGRPRPATPPPRPRGTACRTPPPAGSPPARRP